MKYTPEKAVALLVENDESIIDTLGEIISLEKNENNNLTLNSATSSFELDTEKSIHQTIKDIKYILSTHFVTTYISPIVDEEESEKIRLIHISCNL